MPMTRGRGPRGSSSHQDHRRTSDQRTPEPSEVPPQYAHYIPQARTPPSVTRSCQPTAHSSSQHHSSNESHGPTQPTRPSQTLSHTHGLISTQDPPQPQGPLPPQDPRRVLQFLRDGYTFDNQHAVAQALSKAFRSMQDCSDYRWSYMTPDEQERILNGVYNLFALPMGHTKEMYRHALEKLATDRVKDNVYRARKAAIKKLDDVQDWDRAKACGPTWSTPERWRRYCDLFIQETFQKRSEAGKMNRGKQPIRSTSGSKSFGTIRNEMCSADNRPPSLDKWWTKTHTSGGDWSTPEAKAVMDRYMELYREKFGIPEDEEQTDFDATLWKEVITEREVGPNRRQTLGGLPPKFSFPSDSTGTFGFFGMASTYNTPTSQPGLSEFEFRQLSQAVSSLVNQVSTMSSGIEHLSFGMETLSSRMDTLKSDVTFLRSATTKQQVHEMEDDEDTDEEEEEENEEDVTTYTISHRKRVVISEPGDNPKKKKKPNKGGKDKGKAKATRDAFSEWRRRKF